MVPWGGGIEAEKTFAKMHTLENVSIMLNENEALTIKHLSFFTVAILDEFHTVADMGWMLKCTQCEMCKLSHACKIRKLIKVKFSPFFIFFFDGKTLYSLFNIILQGWINKIKNNDNNQNQKMIICEWKHKFHTALVMGFLMFVQNFCTVIMCPWTEDESTNNMLIM